MSYEYEDVRPAGQFINKKELKAGDKLEGIYQGFHEDKAKKKIHHLETKEGPRMINAGHLDWQLADVAPGTPVLITFMGQEKISKGNFQGNKAYVFNVKRAKGFAPATPAQKAASKLAAPEVSSDTDSKLPVF